MLLTLFLLVVIGVLAVDLRAASTNWLRWISGRQKTGYKKMLLLRSELVKFDMYLLKYTAGVGLPIHRDEVPGYKHYRANFTLVAASDGGDFECANTIFDKYRLVVFRPDVNDHMVTPVESGSRYLLSIGWLVKE